MQRAKRIFSHILGDKILELYKGLIQTRLTTSKVLRDILYSKFLYALPHELPSDLRLRIFGNKQTL